MQRWGLWRGGGGGVKLGRVKVWGGGVKLGQDEVFLGG